MISTYHDFNISNTSNLFKYQYIWISIYRHIWINAPSCRHFRPRFATKLAHYLARCTAAKIRIFHGFNKKTLSHTKPFIIIYRFPHIMISTNMDFNIYWFPYKLHPHRDRISIYHDFNISWFQYKLRPHNGKISIYMDFNIYGFPYKLYLHSGRISTYIDFNISWFPYKSRPLSTLLYPPQAADRAEKRNFAHAAEDRRWGSFPIRYNTIIK